MRVAAAGRPRRRHDDGRMQVRLRTVAGGGASPPSHHSARRRSAAGARGGDVPRRPRGPRGSDRRGACGARRGRDDPGRRRGGPRGIRRRLRRCRLLRPRGHRAHRPSGDRRRAGPASARRAAGANRGRRARSSARRRIGRPPGAARRGWRRGHCPLGDGCHRPPGAGHRPARPPAARPSPAGRRSDGGAGQRRERRHVLRIRDDAARHRARGDAPRDERDRGADGRDARRFEGAAAARRRHPRGRRRRRPRRVGYRSRGRLRPPPRRGQADPDLDRRRGGRASSDPYHHAHGPIRLRHRRGRRGRRGGCPLRALPGCIGGDHRPRPLRRLVPVLGVHALEGAAPRGGRPPRWRRLPVVEGVGLPRLHDQPRRNRYARRLRPREEPRGSRRDGHSRVGLAGRAGTRPRRRPRPRSRNGHPGGRIGQSRASRPPRPRRGAPVDERRGHLDSRAAPVAGDPRRGPDRRRAGAGLRTLWRAGHAGPPAGPGERQGPSALDRICSATP